MLVDSRQCPVDDTPVGLDCPRLLMVRDKRTLQILGGSE